MGGVQNGKGAVGINRPSAATGMRKAGVKLLCVDESNVGDNGLGHVAADFGAKGCAAID
jgi:DNA-binding transcriptional regulator YdaS (Cro superfamily)